MSYATEHNSFTSQCLLNINIYCRFRRLCIINVRTIFNYPVRRYTVDYMVLEASLNEVQMLVGETNIVNVILVGKSL
jgi:hypothetical protein